VQLFPLILGFEQNQPPLSTKPTVLHGHSALTMWSHGKNPESGKSSHTASIRYYAYRLQYSCHVVSTFKNITFTTTHRDLINFHYIDGVLTIIMNILNSPTRQPYDSNISKQATPISRDRQSLDFYRNPSSFFLRYRSEHPYFHLLPFLFKT
jgi:hypothetical protein